MDEVRKKLICDEFEQLLTSYYENEIDEVDKIAFKEHKKECKKCKKSFKMYKEMMTVLKDDEVELPEGFHSRLMEKVNAECFNSDIIKSAEEDLLKDEYVVENINEESLKDIESIKDTNKKEEAIAFVSSVKGKVKEKVDGFVASTEDVREKAFDKVNEVIHKAEENKETKISTVVESDNNFKEKESFFTKISNVLGMKKRTLAMVVTACCAIIALPIAMSFGDNGLKDNNELAKTAMANNNLVDEDANLLMSVSDENSSENVALGAPSVFSARVAIDRATFEPYEVTEDFRTGSFNIVYEDSQKYATELFDNLNNDENVRVLKEQLSKRSSYNVGTTTYTQGEFFSNYGEKAESYNFNQNEIPYVVEEYNSNMTAITNQINLLETAKSYDISNKEIAKLEAEILNLESIRDDLELNFKKIESGLGAYSYSINVSNYNNIWRDGFFTTVLNDITSSINFTFIMLIILIVITIALLILQKVFSQKIEELDFKRHYSKLLKLIIFISSIVSVLFIFNVINDTYDNSYSNNFFEEVMNDIGMKSTEMATSDSSAEIAPDEYEEKIAYSGYVHLESKNLQNTSKKVDSIVEEYDIKIENSSYSNGDTDNMYMSLRVPNAQFDEVYNKLLELGTVIESNKSMENYTDALEIIDNTVNNMDNTISTYKTSLRTFTKADDIIDLTYKIREYEYEKFYNETMATYLEDRVDSSTINLTIVKANSGLVFLQPSFYGNAIAVVLRIVAYTLSFVLLGFLPMVAIYIYNRLSIKIFKIVRFKKITSSTEKEGIFSKTKNKFSKKMVVEDIDENNINDITEVESVVSDVEVMTKEVAEEKTEKEIDMSPIKSTIDEDGIEVLSFKDKYADKSEK